MTTSPPPAPDEAPRLGNCDSLIGDGEPHEQVASCENWRPMAAPLSDGGRVFTPEELADGPDDFPYTPETEMAAFHRTKEVLSDGGTPPFYLDPAQNARHLPLRTRYKCEHNHGKPNAYEPCPLGCNDAVPGLPDATPGAAATDPNEPTLMCGKQQYCVLEHGHEDACVGYRDVRYYIASLRSRLSDVEAARTDIEAAARNYVEWTDCLLATVAKPDADQSDVLAAAEERDIALAQIRAAVAAAASQGARET